MPLASLLGAGFYVGFISSAGYCCRLVAAPLTFHLVHIVPSRLYMVLVGYVSFDRHPASYLFDRSYIAFKRVYLSGHSAHSSRC